MAHPLRDWTWMDLNTSEELKKLGNHLRFRNPGLAFFIMTSQLDQKSKPQAEKNVSIK